MSTITFPIGLPISHHELYVRTINKKYDRFIKLIGKLGGVCTHNQFIEIYKLAYPNLSDTYSKKKALLVLKEMADLKLISINNINTYKYFYLRKFALTIISGDFNKVSQIRVPKLLKDKQFKTCLLRVEYYIRHKEILSLSSLDKQLLNITKDIYNTKLTNEKLPYDLNLLHQILLDKGPKNCKDKIANLPAGNLIKLIWEDLYSIFNSLRLQNQTVMSKPLILKLYKTNNKLTIHYVPEIVIFDLHNINYYSKKVDDLFHKFYHIQSNHTRDMQKHYREDGTLGWEGFNHLAYVIKLIGFNKKELSEKKNYIDSHIKDNPNAILLTNSNIEYIDISKYFTHSSQKKETLENIDAKFDELLMQKINNRK